MKYLEWIKESKAYICPKTGVYKIICVGGGSSGGALASTKYTKRYYSHDGGTTSFGDIISADGGTHCKETKFGSSAGQSGYDGMTYAVPPYMMYSLSSGNYVVAIGAENAKSFDYDRSYGFGAGGGHSGLITMWYKKTTDASTFETTGCQTVFGYCGKMESAIVDLDEGQSIACTIGKGGSNIFTEEEAAEMLNIITNTAVYPYPDIASNVASITSNVCCGTDGVIIVQYLGESM